MSNQLAQTTPIPPPTPAKSRAIASPLARSPAAPTRVQPPSASPAAYARVSTRTRRVQTGSARAAPTRHTASNGSLPRARSRPPTSAVHARVATPARREARATVPHANAQPPTPPTPASPRAANAVPALCASLVPSPAPHARFVCIRETSTTHMPIV
eukprot:2807892-Pleurochrysis_carterae.AAC.5